MFSELLQFLENLSLSDFTEKGKQIEGGDISNGGARVFQFSGYRWLSHVSTSRRCFWVWLLMLFGPGLFRFCCEPMRTETCRAWMRWSGTVGERRKKEHLQKCYGGRWGDLEERVRVTPRLKAKISAFSEPVEWRVSPESSVWVCNFLLRTDLMTFHALVGRASVNLMLRLTDTLPSV